MGLLDGGVGKTPGAIPERQLTGDPEFDALVDSVRSGEGTSEEQKERTKTDIRNLLHRDPTQNSFIRVVALAAGLSEGEFAQLVQEAHDPKYWTPEGSDTVHDRRE